MTTGYHNPVLLEESVAGLNIKQDGVYVDVTFGAGGHSRLILKQLNAKGRLLAFDQDEDAFRNSIDDERFKLIRSNFRWMHNFLKLEGIERVDGILADLGVSSHQFDISERGFTYRADGPLDMRMNASMRKKASDILNNYGFDQLVNVFSSYGEVRNSKSLANKIIELRVKSPYETIGQLLKTLESMVIGSRPKYYAQVFQALRIEVNEEMRVLSKFLTQCGDLVRIGGRLSVISYHSLEDRLVKKFMKSGNVNGLIEKDDFGRNLTPWKLINKKIIVPTEEEVRFNSRAKSAKLRIAEKLENGK